MDATPCGCDSTSNKGSGLTVPLYLFIYFQNEDSSSSGFVSKSPQSSPGASKSSSQSPRASKSPQQDFPRAFKAFSKSSQNINELSKQVK